MKNYLKTVLTVCALSLALATASANAQGLDNRGKEFIVSFTQNYTDGPAIELHLTADVATDVTVEYPVNSPTFSQIVNVVPGTVSIVSLPSSAANDWVPGAPTNNAVRISSTNEFVAYMINRMPYTSDAAVALPVDTMNKDYIVMTYDEAFSYSQFVVTAAFDNTTVTITPNIDTTTGNTAGVPFQVVLNRGEGYYLRGNTTGPNSSFAGTIVSSDKPVGLTNGNGCTQVPYGTAYCDSIFEVAQPTQTWGNFIPVVNLPNRPDGSIYRILAANDNTTLSLDGAVIATLNRGEFFETAPLADSHVFSADKAIFVDQFMTGSTSPGATQGDPAMGNMVPTEQYLTSYTFSTVGGNQFASHFLTIIANNLDLNTLLLDGVIVGAGAFTPIPGTNFSAAVLPLSEGTHTTSSVNGHGITVEGYNQDDSYLYPGGAKFNFINATGDANAPICSLSGLNGLAIDNRASEDTNNNGILDAGEDLNANNQIDTDSGVFFVQLEDGSSNVTLNVPSFVPGSGQVNFSVALVDPALPPQGVVRVTDGAGNFCQAFVGGSATCSQSDISSSLFTLDGGALNLKKFVNKAAKQLKNVGASALANDFKVKAAALYTSTWTDVWSIPPQINACDNTLLCPEVAHTSQTSSIANSLVEFKKLVNSAVKAAANKKGEFSPGLKKLKSDAAKLIKKLNTTLTQIPSASDACGAGVQINVSNNA